MAKLLTHMFIYFMIIAGIMLFGMIMGQKKKYYHQDLDEMKSNKRDNYFGLDQKTYPTETMTIYNNGNKKFERKKGKCYEYYDNGNIYAEYQLIDNYLEGLYTEYHYYGAEKIKCYYKENVLHGKYQEWNENEISLLTCNYKEGILDGKYLEFHGDGQIKLEYYYDHGRIIDVSKLYDKFGRDCNIGKTKGPIEVWKACKVFGVPAYVKLLVPSEAKRITPIQGNKCVYKSRISYGLVTQIIDREGNNYSVARSFVHGDATEYFIDRIITPDYFDDNIGNDCSFGISVHAYKDQCDVWY